MFRVPYIKSAFACRPNNGDIKILVDLILAQRHGRSGNPRFYASGYHIESAPQTQKISEIDREIGAIQSKLIDPFMAKKVHD